MDNTEPITAREPARPLHLWTVAAGGGKPRQLTSGVPSALGAPSWSADDKRIAVALAPNATMLTAAASAKPTDKARAIKDALRIGQNFRMIFSRIK